MAKPKKTVKPKAKSTPKVFCISLAVGGKHFESKGDSALVALETLEQPAKIFSKGVLTITYGERKNELLLQPVQIKRLFYKVARPFIAKNLVMGLK